MSTEATAAPITATATPTSAVDTTTIAAPAAQAATPAATQPTTAPVATPTVPATPPAEVQMTSAQLKARLDETSTKAAAKARDELLKELGTDAAGAKAAVARAKELEDAQKSEIEKAMARATKAEVRAKRADDLEEIIAGRLIVEETALTDAQRAAVAAVAGDDPALRLKTITALRPTWAVAAPPAPIVVPVATPPVVVPAAVATPVVVPPVTATPAAPPAPLAAPVSTMPSGTAPAPTSVAPTDHLRILGEHEKANPFYAAAYAHQFRAEIDAARKQQAARPG